MIGVSLVKNLDSVLELVRDTPCQRSDNLMAYILAIAVYKGDIGFTRDTFENLGLKYIKKKIKFESVVENLLELYTDDCEIDGFIKHLRSLSEKDRGDKIARLCPRILACSKSCGQMKNILPILLEDIVISLKIARRKYHEYSKQSSFQPLIVGPLLHYTEVNINKFDVLSDYLLAESEYSLKKDVKKYFSKVSKSIDKILRHLERAFGKIGKKVSVQLILDVVEYSHVLQAILVGVDDIYYNRNLTDLLKRFKGFYNYIKKKTPRDEKTRKQYTTLLEIMSDNIATAFLMNRRLDIYEKIIQMLSGIDAKYMSILVRKLATNLTNITMAEKVEVVEAIIKKYTNIPEISNYRTYDRMSIEVLLHVLGGYYKYNKKTELLGQIIDILEYLNIEEGKDLLRGLINITNFLYRIGAYDKALEYMNRTYKELNKLQPKQQAEYGCEFIKLVAEAYRVKQ